MAVWDTVMKSIGLGSNRRSWDRAPVDTPVTLLVGGERIACQIADVSPKGAFVTPALDLPIGTAGTLEIPQCLIQAEIRVVRHTPNGVGLEFVADGVGAIVAGWTKGLSADRAPGS